MVCPAWSVGTAERRFLRLGVVCPRAFGAFLAFGCSVLPRFSGSAGKNRKSPSITRYLATKPQVAETQNRGLVGRSRFYPALLESPHGSMRQIPEPPSTPPFSHREAAGRGVVVSRCARQVLNLPHTSGFCFYAGCVHLNLRLNNGQNTQFRLHTKTPAGAKLLLPALACLLVPFRLAQRPVLDPYASVGSTPSSLRTSSKAAAMALSMS